MLHDTALQHFGGIAIFNVNSLLGDDLTAVRDLVYKVNGGAGDLDTLLKGGLVDLQAIHALAAEGGDQGGMDIQDPAGPLAGEVLAEDAHEARQDDELHPVVSGR